MRKNMEKNKIINKYVIEYCFNSDKTILYDYYIIEKIINLIIENNNFVNF